MDERLSTDEQHETRKSRGQALIEYALILALLAIAFGVALAATGPAIGNVFSNTVYNLIGQDVDDPFNVAQLNNYGGPDSFWLTVTWVAEHPQLETPFPTRQKIPTDVPTPGPSPTPSPTVPTPTPTPTSTIGPTATPVDGAWDLPFYENVDTLERWRLDDSIYLGGDAWLGKYYSNTTFTPTVPDPLNPGQYKPDWTLYNYELNPRYVFNIDFDWGVSGAPIQFGSYSWRPPSGFSIRYSRKIFLQQAMSLTFTTAAADSVRVLLDGAQIINGTGSYPTMDDNRRVVTQTVGAGLHDLVVEYIEYSGSAGVMLDVRKAGGKKNVDDDTIPSGSTPDCTWGRTFGTDASTVQWMFDENPSADFGANRVCYLELRGKIRLGGATRPMLSFWDVWDFSGGSTGRAKLQIAEYVEASPGILDRSALAWQTINMHTDGTANYNWTRALIDLSNVNGTSFVGKDITLRFVIENPGGTTGRRRWYIDDIRVQQETAPGTVTIGNQWDLNNTAQKADFITSETWDLTANRTKGPGLAWDDTPGYNYAYFSAATSGQYRIYYVEFKDLVDLRTGVAPAQDLEGDAETPMISFWHSFHIGQSTRLEVQYTTNARDAVPDTWTMVPNGLLAQASGTQLFSTTMQKVELPLNTIPNYTTTPFRLRFAMLVPTNSNNNSNRDGWYIDNIYIERAGPPHYADYPFFDDAESASFMLENWQASGTWGPNFEGRFSGRSYSDSPDGDYIPGGIGTFEMNYYLDLNNNTQLHRDQTGGVGYAGGAATRPILSFWHRRDISSGTVFAVDMYYRDNATGNWAWSASPIWSYISGQSSPSTSPLLFDKQDAWERVEVDLAQAYLNVTGRTIAAAVGTAPDDDDDIRLRFRLTAGSVADDGVVIDDISIKEYSETRWRLWSSGDGETYTDDIEGTWYNRWYYGGSWEGASTETHSGLDAFADSPDAGENYANNTISVLEMQRIIDLTSVNGANDKPRMYFWTMRRVDSTDDLYVQIARENTGSTTIGYDRMKGWNTWTTVWSSTGSFNKSRFNQAWTREMIDLNQSSFPGSRIKVRFVLEAGDSSGVADGWFIDDVRFALAKNDRVFDLPFLDLSQSTGNWVTEGTWGLAPDRWKGAGGGPAALGTNQWQTTFLHCNMLSKSPFSGVTNRCNQNATSYERLLRLVDDTMPPASPDIRLNQISAANQLHNIYRATVPDLQFVFGSYSPVFPPPNSPQITCYDQSPIPSGCPTWPDNWAMYATRRINIQQAGTYTFTIVTNDSVRAKIIGPGLSPAANQYNLFNRWGPFTDGVKTETRIINLAVGDYDIILHWAEGTAGAAFLNFNASNNNFSFTDSPNSPNASGGYDKVNSIQFADSSLLLNGTLDLNGFTNPIIEWYTTYELCKLASPTDSSCPSVSSSNRTNARIEVSQDGGFSWTQTGLSTACCSLTMDNPTITSDTQTLLEGWQLRRQNLTTYINRFIGLRFRLTTVNQQQDGWYITEIRINQ